VKENLALRGVFDCGSIDFYNACLIFLDQSASEKNEKTCPQGDELARDYYFLIFHKLN
jgi:hypothetical protein